MIERIIEQKIKEKLKENKAIIFLGARQTGKTTILKKMFAGISEALWLNADEPDVQAMFETASSSRLKAIFENYRYIVIDSD
ncbi:MAG: AAA family ATPase [Bacteroidota bacterium]